MGVTVLYLDVDLVSRINIIYILVLNSVYPYPSSAKSKPLCWHTQRHLIFLKTGWTFDPIILYFCCVLDHCFTSGVNIFFLLLTFLWDKWLINLVYLIRSRDLWSIFVENPMQRKDSWKIALFQERIDCLIDWLMLLDHVFIKDFFPFSKEVCL
jgi:hypothetical protein